LPIDAMVEIEELGVFRIADRGRLGSSGWVDVAVWTRAEAFAATGVRRICVTPPRESPIEQKTTGPGPIFRPRPEETR
jgi:hypothetical protein